jgi:hypothetical protein
MLEPQLSLKPSNVKNKMVVTLLTFLSLTGLGLGLAIEVQGVNYLFSHSWNKNLEYLAEWSSVIAIFGLIFADAIAIKSFLILIHLATLKVYIRDKTFYAFKRNVTKTIDLSSIFLVRIARTRFGRKQYFFFDDNGVLVLALGKIKFSESDILKIIETLNVPLLGKGKQTLNKQLKDVAYAILKKPIGYEGDSFIPDDVLVGKVRDLDEGEILYVGTQFDGEIFPSILRLARKRGRVYATRLSKKRNAKLKISEADNMNEKKVEFNGIESQISLNLLCEVMGEKNTDGQRTRALLMCDDFAKQVAKKWNPRFFAISQIALLKWIENWKRNNTSVFRTQKEYSAPVLQKTTRRFRSQIDMPIIGYRAWMISGGYLMAPANLIPWPKGSPLKAIHPIFRDGDHKCNLFKECSCGIYALHTLDLAIEYWKEVGGHDLVFGAVLCWGESQIAENGTRTQWGQPLALIDPDSLQANSDIRAKLAIKDATREVGSAYGIPSLQTYQLQTYVNEFGISPLETRWAPGNEQARQYSN